MESSPGLLAGQLLTVGRPRPWILLESTLAAAPNGAMAAKAPHYFLPEWIQPTNESLNVDVCVYGGNASGIPYAKLKPRLEQAGPILEKYAE